MAYTDRYYATSDDEDQFPNDPFRKFFGGGLQKPSPTPTPTPKPTQLAMLGDPTGVLSRQPDTNAANRVNGSRYIAEGGRDLGPQYDDRGRVNALPGDAVGIQGTARADQFNTSLGYQPPNSQPVASTIPKQMTHTEMAVDIARRNLAAQYPQQNQGTQESTDPNLRVAAAMSRADANRVSQIDPAFRPGAIAAATASQPLKTATQPGQGALDIVPVGTPLMSVKGIVDPFTGKTNYQPLNQPSPYQGPTGFQREQAATDFYRRRQQDQSGYGTAY